VSLAGIWGHPFLDLEGLIPLDGLEAVHEEICRGLARVEAGYTGGSHRSLGIMPPSRQAEAHGDYGEAIARLTPEQRRQLAALGEDADGDGGGTGSTDGLDGTATDFGEDARHPLTLAQLRYLEYVAGVYFPWKVHHELLPNRWWHEKSSGAGKAFTDEALELFPLTVALVRALPFEELGWVKILGLKANDHGTIHRDGDPAHPTVANFITLCPAGNKRFFLWDEESQRKVYAPSRAYWFNDCDYHGVEADPFFRYSLRVDGRFTPDLINCLLDRHVR
jgi:hypothetical protein